MSDGVILTVIGTFVAVFGGIAHLYSMVFDIRRQVNDEMDKRLAEFNRKMDVLQGMLQADRQLREETRVINERELGRTVKHDDLQRIADRLLGEIREVKQIAGSAGGMPHRRGA